MENVCGTWCILKVPLMKLLLHCIYFPIYNRSLCRFFFTMGNTCVLFGFIQPCTVEEHLLCSGHLAKCVSPEIVSVLIEIMIHCGNSKTLVVSETPKILTKIRFPGFTFKVSPSQVWGEVLAICISSKFTSKG